MARKPPPLLTLLLLICFRAITVVADFQLTDEILFFVPECTRECFLSFLDVNFEENPCQGGLTSLQCLCANRGASGFTIGEGLVQCLAAEKAIEFCSPEDASDDAFRLAFGMCNGKPNAIPATNSVFTATLIMPPSGPGVVSFPPLTTTRTDFDEPNASTTTTSSRTTSEATLETDTSEPPQTTGGETTSGFTTSVRTSTSENLDPTEPPVPDIPAGDDADTDGANDQIEDDEDEEDGESSEDLGAAQVAGISVGVASAAGLAAIAILVARHYRRQRRLPDLKSLFSKRDTWPYPEKLDGGDGGLGGSGSMAGVARQIEQPLDTSLTPRSDPPAYNGSAGFYSPAIGVAVASPSDRDGETAQPTPPRPVSRLLPAKPVYVPGGARRNSPSPSGAFQDATMVSSPSRIQTTSPRGAGLTLADTIQTRQQPSPTPPSGSQQSPRRFLPNGPAPASSTATTNAQIPAPAQPFPNINKPQPPVPLQPPNRLADPPPAVLERDSAVTEFEEDGGLSARSTGVSVANPRASGNNAAGGQVWVPPSRHPISGLTYYFSDQNGNWVLRDSQAGQQQQQQQQQYTNQSNIHPALRSSTLAPAAEISSSSQQTPARQQYPHASSLYSPSVPRPLFSGPRRSSLSKPNNPPPNNGGYTPYNPYPRRSSDDSGVTQFSSTSDIELPQSAAPTIPLSPVVESPPEKGSARGLYPNNGRNPNNLRLAAGPPRCARQYHPPGQPSPTLGLMNPPPGPYTKRNQEPLRPLDTTIRAVSPSPDRDLLPSATQQRNHDLVSPLSPLKPHFSRSSATPWRPPVPLQSQYSHPQPQAPQQQQQQQQRPNFIHQPPSPTSSANTTSSSLLSKRLGPTRAADMSFPAMRPPSTQTRWRQRDDPNGNGFLSPETPRRQGEQPSTPTWVPRLTPTRRGDDLYLNVQ